MRFLYLILIVIVAAFLVGCNEGKKEENNSDNTKTEEIQKSETKESKDMEGLVIEDIKIGDGAEVKKGDTVLVHYTGYLTNGSTFDSSKKRNQPFSFQVGQGYVIKGWDLGVVGMKVGGERKLTISPELGYGNREIAGIIPANSTLIFEIELLDIM